MQTVENLSVSNGMKNTSKKNTFFTLSSPAALNASDIRDLLNYAEKNL